MFGTFVKGFIGWLVLLAGIPVFIGGWWAGRPVIGILGFLMIFGGGYFYRLSRQTVRIEERR